MDRQVNGWIVRETDVCVGGQMDRMDRWIDDLTGGWKR